MEIERTTPVEDMGGRELYYVDENGVKQDAELWDEILGDDDQDTIQLEDLVDSQNESESVQSPVGKLAELRQILGRTFIRR